MNLCPCSSGRYFQDCCEPFHLGTKSAPTPETLMRSRYSAYALANIDYIERTMRAPANKNFNRDQTQQFALESKWQKLEIIRSYQPSADVGYVEFIAHYHDQYNHPQHIHENSEFHLVEGQWYYVQGEHQPSHLLKVGRNEPCPCGSGKKYKKCCGAKM